MEPLQDMTPTREIQVLSAVFDIIGWDDKEEVLLKYASSETFGQARNIISGLVFLARRERNSGPAVRMLLALDSYLDEQGAELFASPEKKDERLAALEVCSGPHLYVHAG